MFSNLQKPKHLIKQINQLIKWFLLIYLYLFFHKSQYRFINIAISRLSKANLHNCSIELIINVDVCSVLTILHHLYSYVLLDTV